MELLVITSVAIVFIYDVFFRTDTVKQVLKKHDGPLPKPKEKSVFQINAEYSLKKKSETKKKEKSKSFSYEKRPKIYNDHDEYLYKKYKLLQSNNRPPDILLDFEVSKAAHSVFNGGETFKRILTDIHNDGVSDGRLFEGFHCINHSVINSDNDDHKRIFSLYAYPLFANLVERNIKGLLKYECVKIIAANERIPEAITTYIANELNDLNRASATRTIPMSKKKNDLTSLCLDQKSFMHSLLDNIQKDILDKDGLPDSKSIVSAVKEINEKVLSATSNDILINYLDIRELMFQVIHEYTIGENTALHCLGHTKYINFESIKTEISKNALLKYSYIL